MTWNPSKVWPLPLRFQLKSIFEWCSSCRMLAEMFLSLFVSVSSVRFRRREMGIFRNTFHEAIKELKLLLSIIMILHLLTVLLLFLFLYDSCQFGLIKTIIWKPHKGVFKWRVLWTSDTTRLQWLNSNMVQRADRCGENMKSISLFEHFICIECSLKSL